MDENKQKSYYNFNKEKDSNPHYFLCEELLVPRANNSDSQRLNMFSSHITQLVHLKDPEFPRVFTNFEDQVGEYSMAYKKAEDDFVIISKIIKNEYNYDLIVRYKTSGVYDIIHYNTSHNITEDYGYQTEDCIADAKIGDTIKKDHYLYKSSNFDNDGNFSYGINLRAVYLPYKNLTYEDGIVISKSAAKRFTSYKVEKTTISVNSNDVLLNLYGDENVYKSFPKVGDMTKQKILVASRRRNNKTATYDFQSKNLRNIVPGNDDVTYTEGGGKITDITVYNNIPLEILRKKTDEFSQEVLTVVENQYRYFEELAEELEKIIPFKDPTENEMAIEKSSFGHVAKHALPRGDNKNRYTDEVGYYWKLAHESLDEKIRWRDKGKSFDNYKIEFEILREDPLVSGSKITGRYGNKGVATLIEDDENMPMTIIDGKEVHAEVCLNPLGVINRLNISQLQEQYLNSMANHVLEEIKSKTSIYDKEDIFFEFMKLVNPKEYDFLDMKYIMMNRQEKEDFFIDIEKNGIYIHQPPFFGNTTMEQFEEIYKKHPSWCEKYKFVGIERPLAMGELYFIKLKHSPANKSSFRSATNLNTKDLPSKSTLKKNKKIMYSSNALRMGEMEVTNLMLPKRGDIVEKFLKTYSTSSKLRSQTILSLLDPGKDENGKSINPLNMKLKFGYDKSISRQILEKELNVLELVLTDDNNDDTKI